MFIINYNMMIIGLCNLRNLQQIRKAQQLFINKSYLTHQSSIKNKI